MPAAAFALIELEPARPSFNWRPRGKGFGVRPGLGSQLGRQWQLDLLVESEQMQAGVKGGVSAVLDNWPLRSVRGSLVFIWAL